MIKSYQLKLYPNQEQAKKIEDNLAAKVFCYNYFLNIRLSYYYETGKNYPYEQTTKELKELKVTEAWLKGVDSVCLINTLRDLDRAMFRFYKGISKHPTEKTTQSTLSYRTNHTKINGNQIRIPKIGYIRFRGGRLPTGRILSVTIKKDIEGYYAILCAEASPPDAPKPEITTNIQNAIGIDVGVEHLCILSNGVKYENKKFLAKGFNDRLKRLNNEKSKCKKGGKKYQKIQAQILKELKAIANRRKDYLHKVSREIVDSYDCIFAEDFDAQSLIACNPMPGILLDVGFAELIRMIEYKSKEAGKIFGKVPPQNTSKICSNCGYLNLKINNCLIRNWTCPICGEEHDRDINAAKNILAKGLASM